MVNTELRQGPVAVLTSWMRNERHTIAMRSAMRSALSVYGVGWWRGIRDVILRNYFPFHGVLSTFYHFWKIGTIRDHTGPYGMTNGNM